MKTTQQPSLRSRRLFLAALLGSPLFLCLRFSVGKTSSPAPAHGDNDGFVIINGWVMLKRDLTEDGA